MFAINTLYQFFFFTLSCILCIPFIYLVSIVILQNAENKLIPFKKEEEKKAVIIISHANYPALTKPLFLKLKILNVFDFSDFNLAIFMYLCYNELIPTSLSDKCCLNTEVHAHNTRGSSNFPLPKIRTCVSKNSVFLKGRQFWTDYLHI